MSSDADKALRDARELSLDEIDEAIRQLELQIAPALGRLSALKKMARARRAAAASAKARAAKKSAEAIKARHSAIQGSRGRIELLAEEFNRSTRTIHRKLGPKATRKK